MPTIMARAGPLKMDPRGARRRGGWSNNGSLGTRGPRATFHRKTRNSTTRPRQYTNGPSGNTQLTSAIVGTLSPSNVLYSPNDPAHGVSTTVLPMDARTTQPSPALLRRMQAEADLLAAVHSRNSAAIQAAARTLRNALVDWGNAHTALRQHEQSRDLAAAA